MRFRCYVPSSDFTKSNLDPVLLNLVTDWLTPFIETSWIWLSLLKMPKTKLTDVEKSVDYKLVTTNSLILILILLRFSCLALAVFETMFLIHPSKWSKNSLIVLWRWDLVLQAGPITVWGTNSNCIHFICKISKHNVLSDNSRKRPGCFMTPVTRGAGSITVWGSNGCQQVVELIIRCQLGAHVSVANITQLPLLMLSVQLIDDMCLTTKQEKNNMC